MFEIYSCVFADSYYFYCSSNFYFYSSDAACNYFCASSLAFIASSSYFLNFSKESFYDLFSSLIFPSKAAFSQTNYSFSNRSLAN